MSEPVTDDELEEARRQLPDCRYDEDYGNVAMKDDLLPRLIAEVRRLRAERDTIAADAVNRLKACQADCDTETAHGQADGILCDTLDKWYA